MVTKGAVVLLTVFIASKITYCQTCCTGSAPTIGSMRVSSVDAKKWNINILFEHNNISDIIIKKNKINDNSINRATNTILLQTT